MTSEPSAHQASRGRGLGAEWFGEGGIGTGGRLADTPPSVRWAGTPIFPSLACLGLVLPPVPHAAVHQLAELIAGVAAPSYL